MTNPLPEDWVDNIGMVEDAEFLNAVGAAVNENTNAIAAAAPAPSAVFDAAPGSVTGSAYAPLGTTGQVEITVPASGRLLVIIRFDANSNAGSSQVSYSMSGANTRAATDTGDVVNISTGGGSLSAFRVEAGLNPGLTTLQLQYKTQYTRVIANCCVAAIPLG